MGTAWYVDATVIVMAAFGIALTVWLLYRRRRPVRVPPPMELMENARWEMDEVYAAHGQRVHLADRRPDVVGLAMAVGLLVFLIAEALPGGGNGAKGFWIGAGGLVGLVVLLLLVAITVDTIRDAREARADGLYDFVFARLVDQVAAFQHNLTEVPAGTLVDLLRSWESLKGSDRQASMQLLAEHARFFGEEQEFAEMMAKVGEASPSQRYLLTFLVRSSR